MSSVVTDSIDKGEFYYFKTVTERTVFYAGLSRELRNSQCCPYGSLEVCFIVTKEHIEDLKLPVYCGPRTLKLENKESMFFVAANFEFIALWKWGSECISVCLLPLKRGNYSGGFH